MTVAELIELLQEQDPNAKVVAYFSPSATSLYKDEVTGVDTNPEGEVELV